MKKINLTKIVLAGALGIVTANCSTVGYPFSGLMIDDSDGMTSVDGYVKYTEWYFPKRINTIEVRQGDAITLYSDAEGNDLKIESLDINYKGKTTTFYNNGLFPEFMDRAQQEFELYLGIAKAYSSKNAAIGDDQAMIMITVPLSEIK